jgi:hypothetical protein
VKRNTGRKCSKMSCGSRRVDRNDRSDGTSDLSHLTVGAARLVADGVGSLEVVQDTEQLPQGEPKARQHIAASQCLARCEHDRLGGGSVDGDGSCSWIDQPENAATGREVLVDFSRHLLGRIALAEQFNGKIGGEWKDRSKGVTMVCEASVGGKGQIGNPYEEGDNRSIPASPGSLPIRARLPVGAHGARTPLGISDA